MVENHHLERLSEIMKAARGHVAKKLEGSDAETIGHSPFGGCQIIATGDFFQLPPVLPFQCCIECGSLLLKEPRQGETTHRCPHGHGQWHDSSKWAFQSEVWNKADFAHVELRQIHRQAGDPTFIEILNRVRHGTFTKDDVKVLTDPSRETKDMTNAVRLYPTRAKVARYNADRLRELKTPPYDFVVRDSFHWNEKAHPHLKALGWRQADGTLAALRQHQYAPFLRLKVGMPVILLSNIDIKRGRVNGSQGTVVDFAPTNDVGPFSHRKRPTGVNSGFVSKIVDEELFQHATSLTHPVSALPVVQFDNDGKKEVIYPECSVHERGNEGLYTGIDPDDEPWDPGDEPWDSHKPSVLCRTQIPLVAGWAMSIHKAQGMTLGKVIVDLTGI